jgi:hypothetical protein
MSDMADPSTVKNVKSVERFVSRLKGVRQEKEMTIQELNS